MYIYIYMCFMCIYIYVYINNGETCTNFNVRMRGWGVARDM